LLGMNKLCPYIISFKTFNISIPIFLNSSSKSRIISS
jgi:hypothetical protein